MKQRKTNADRDGRALTDWGIDMLPVGTDAPTPVEVSRAEHLAWCQARAYRYCDQGDLANALASFTSDLRKHPETAGDHPALRVGLLQLRCGYIATPAEMREFLAGFR